MIKISSRDQSTTHCRYQAHKSYAKRPKWAKALTLSQWVELWSCQAGKPTKTALKEDLEYQQQEGIICHSCRSAGLAVGVLKHEA